MGIKDMLENFQAAMEATAFAEEGEHEAARQLLKQAKNSNKKILLVMDGGERDFQEALRHSWALSKRLNGRLEILYLQAKEAVNEITSEQGGAGNQDDILVVYSPLAADQGIESKVAEYTEGRSDILCVVLASTQAETNAAGAKPSPDPVKWLMDKLNCPVVVFSGGS
jgi:hypothetical protein